VIKILDENIPFKQKEVHEDGQEKPDMVSNRLNKYKRAVLDSSKKLLEQPKDSTALWTLAELGANVLHGNETGMILRTIFKNKRNNKRNNISDFE